MSGIDWDRLRMLEGGAVTPAAWNELLRLVKRCYVSQVIGGERRDVGPHTVVDVSKAVRRGGAKTPPPFWPLRISRNEADTAYEVTLQPGRLVEPLEQVVHDPVFGSTPLVEKPVIEMEAGQWLVLNYETDEDGVVDTATVAVTVEASLPSQEVEWIEVDDDPGRTGVYAIPLGQLVDEDASENPIPPQFSEAVRSDVWHRPYAVPAENVGDGAEILAAFAGGYKFRTIAPAPGDDGETAGDLVEGRVQAERVGDQVQLRGTAKNMNVYVRRIRVSEGATPQDPPFLEYINPTEVDFTLYWRDGQFLGSQEPEEEIGPCHHLVELDLATITQPTERPPCPEE